MIDGYALADIYATVAGRLLVLLLLLVPLAFSVGWYCGDRWNLPGIRIEAR